ncbi:MAG: hypothetical protein ACRDMI_13790 [Streptosporangiaceae bacterium]
MRYQSSRFPAGRSRPEWARFRVCPARFLESRARLARLPVPRARLARSRRHRLRPA